MIELNIDWPLLSEGGVIALLIGVRIDAHLRDAAGSCCRVLHLGIIGGCCLWGCP